MQEREREGVVVKWLPATRLDRKISGVLVSDKRCDRNGYGWSESDVAISSLAFYLCVIMIPAPHSSAPPCHAAFCSCPKKMLSLHSTGGKG